MRFLVDAHLPRRLALHLIGLGYEAKHTLDLPSGNRTSDSALCAEADATGAVMVTKDADFVINRTLHGTPQRLLIIATGNIANAELISLIEGNLASLATAFRSSAHVELNRTSLIVHD